MKSLWHWAMAFGSLFLPMTCLSEVKPFDVGSLDSIETQHRDRPFIVILWSLDCPPCLTELQTVSELRDLLPPSHVVLVSTDVGAPEDEIAGLLRRFDLHTYDNWVFANANNVKLRYHIDPQWFGELPRVYLYDIAHRRTAHSGTFSRPQLTAWSEKNVASP